MQSNDLIASDVPQILVEPILNLYKAGTSPQTISQSFNLSLDAVVTFLSKQQSDPALNFFQALERKSKDFRCSVSSRLMVNPVVASDGKIYDSKALNDWLKTSKVSPVTGEPLSKTKFFPLLDLKERVKEFAKSALFQIEPVLRLNLEEEAPLIFTAECIALLLSDEENLATSLQRLSNLETPKQKLLIDHLVKLIEPASQSRLLIELASLETFHASATQLFTSLLEQREVDQLLDEEFNCLIGMISRPEPSCDLLKLAFKASMFSNKEQLFRLQEVLRSVCTAENLEFTKLKLRNAELSVHAKDLEAAKAIIGEIKQDPMNRKSLLEFYDRVGWWSEKKAYLSSLFNSSLASLVTEDASDSLLTCLDSLLELSACNLVQPDVSNFKIKRLRRVGKKQQADLTPDRIYSYVIDTNNLHWVEIHTSTRGTAQVPGITFKYWCTWVELPNCNLLVGGGSADQAFSRATQEVFEIDVETFEVTQKPQMLFARWAHGCLLYEGEVYMISGMDGSSKHIREVERYNLLTETWEALALIPNEVRCINPYRVDDNIYVLGGYNNATYQDSVQEYNITTDTWTLLSLKLTATGYLLPCFQLSLESTDIFFHQNSCVYKFDTEEKTITNVKSIEIPSQHYQGPSYYFEGNLFLAFNSGEVVIAPVGEIE